MSGSAEANDIWRALEPKVNAAIDQRAKNVIRSRRMNVTTAAANGVLGVTEPFGAAEIFVPYSTALASVAVGSSVRVVWFDGNMSTAVALWTGSVV